MELKATAGGEGGSWYVLMEGLAELVAEVHPDIQIEVVAGGGVMNHALVGTGEIPMGILNPPMISAALAGRTPYDRLYPELRTAVSNLTVNHLQFFVEQDIPLTSLDGWLEKKHPLRIPVDRVGTVDRMVFQLALAHFGKSEEDIEGWGGKNVPAMSYDEQLALYRHGEVNALWQFMGIPSPSLQVAHAIRPIKPLSFPQSLIAELEGLGWEAAQLPIGAYGAVPEAIPTIAMSTSLGFHSGVSDDVVYAITSAICDNPQRVHQIHPAAEYFDPSKAHIITEGQLHSGAERYSREKGYKQG